MRQHLPRRPAARIGAARARGLALIGVLLVLALMLLAGAGAMRAVDTGNVVAGNFAFQQAARQSADRAMTDALNTLSAAVLAGAGNTPVNNRYISVRTGAVDSRGFPSGIDWTTVACVDPLGAAVVNCGSDSGEYRIQYVIERMCTANPNMNDINDIRAKCEFEANVSAVSATSIDVRYRVIMRVRGPRGTENWFEAMVSGPAST